MGLSDVLGHHELGPGTWIDGVLDLIHERSNQENPELFGPPGFGDPFVLD
jgi:hypothetical protein